jgi:hypothetical protein
VLLARISVLTPFVRVRNDILGWFAYESSQNCCFELEIRVCDDENGVAAIKVAWVSHCRTRGSARKQRNHSTF